MNGEDHSREKVGDYLKRERESRRVSLEEISQNTRISQPYLEALERNDFRFFSRLEYIQGFLRGYARYIGLDPNDVLKRYDLQMEIARLQGTFHQLPLFQNPGAANEEVLDPPAQEPISHSRKEKFLFSYSIYIQILVLAAALSLSFYLYRALKQLDQESVPPRAESPAPKEGRKGAETKMKTDLPKEDSKEKKSLEKGSQEAKDSPADLSDPGTSKTRGGKDSGRNPSPTPKGKIFGNPDTKIYYLPGMKGYEGLKSGRKMEFNSEEEAKKMGYRRGLH